MAFDATWASSDVGFGWSIRFPCITLCNACGGLNLETAVDRLNSLKVRMYKRVWQHITVTDMVTNATGAIARFLGSLAGLQGRVAPPSRVQPASSSRLASKPKKRTLTPVLLPFLG
jgi:hypothetical protein